jgi:hypothetical protein
MAVSDGSFTTFCRLSTAIAASARYWVLRSSFEFKILGQEDWTGRRMIADRFPDGRVFLCGDAAHIWVPFAGYGMNAGIADAVNLSWMLAGVIKGWADPALLDAYEIERQPITQQVSRYAMNTALARASQRSTMPDNIEQVGPEGDAVRAGIGREAYEINVGQFCSSLPPSSSGGSITDSLRQLPTSNKGPMPVPEDYRTSQFPPRHSLRWIQFRSGRSQKQASHPSRR